MRGRDEERRTRTPSETQVSIRVPDGVLEADKMNPHEGLRALEHAGLRPILERALERYRRDGDLRGKARLEPEAAEALQRLTGRPSRSLDLAELDAALRDSKKYAISLLPVLEALNGGPILVRRERRAELGTRWRDLLERTLDAEWRTSLECGEAGAKRLRIALRDGRELESTIRTVNQAITALRLEVMRLPVLAARVAGNAHALDADTLAGQVLQDAIAALKIEAPVRDGVSSSVLIARIEGAPWLDSLGNRAVHLPWREVVTLERLQSRTGQTLVVENPSVFEALLEANCAHALVCTQGQRSLAALELLDRLEGTLWLNCDFDWGGLWIFTSLLERYATRVRAWRFDATHYLAALERSGGVPLERDLEPFAARFPELVREMRAHRRGAHQEAILSDLIEDAHRMQP
jgi:uncharacterized protein (TIGR02679 family)